MQCLKVWQMLTTRVLCSNAAKMQNPLKLAGVPQTPKPISAASEPKFAILLGHVEEILMFNIFLRLSIHALVVKIQSDKVVRWCADGDFCVLYFQRAACSISDLHSKLTLRPYHV